MDESERLVEKYLNALNQGLVVFEPDGNIPPDFVIAGKIAVEVRRLNQNYELPDGTIEGLENLDISLWRKIGNLLSTLGPSINGESWIVAMDFCRPIAPWRQLKAKILQELELFMRDPHRKPKTISISNNLSLDLQRASKDIGSFFLLGCSGDDDAGGWVMCEVEKNLKLCIAEKGRKIAPYSNRYNEWWLILTDHIDFSMELEDQDEFRTKITPTLQHSFDKIILLDPLNHLRAFEI